MAGMAQPYAHSETAADTQVKTEAPRMADQLLQKMIASVPKADRPAMIVVHKVDWVGASAPNTVCAGACKHALMDITDEVVTAVTESRHSNKARLKDEEIHIRGSQKLTTNGHVRGDQKYPQGFGNIGGKPLGSGAAQHKRVLEYPPRKEPADKPEKKPAKRPRKDPSDEPRKKPRLEIDD